MEISMSDKKKVIIVTGAGRGMGADIAKALLSAGHKVIATGRNPDNVRKVLGEGENLLVVKLDVTDLRDAEAVAKQPLTASAILTC